MTCANLANTQDIFVFSISGIVYTFQGVEKLYIIVRLCLPLLGLVALLQNRPKRALVVRVGVLCEFGKWHAEHVLHTRRGIFGMLQQNGLASSSNLLPHIEARCHHLGLHFGQHLISSSSS